MKTIALISLIMSASVFGYSQDFNKVVFDEKAQRDVMQGLCDEDGLKTTVWAEFYDAVYNEYQPDMELIIQLSAALQGVDVVVTVGTWCGDSKKHVPAFLKLLRAMNFDFSRLTIIALDRNFDAGDGIGERPYNTEKVPTFIFYSEQKELGRIIETPEGTLEEHMKHIFGL
jgi:hypothetical protein